MNEEAIYTKISNLPSPIKKEIFDYIEFLIQRHNTEKKNVHPKAGCMKGVFIMSEDFNAPLETFKEYMP